MNKALRIIATSAMTAALGMGAGALPASAAVPASTATTSSFDQSSFQHRHQMRDSTRHDTVHGWFDKESRWHNRADGNGWRDDHGNWRSDNDHRGTWTGRDGCRHDKDGFWDHHGHRHNHHKDHHHGGKW